MNAECLDHEPMIDPITDPVGWMRQQMPIWAEQRKRYTPRPCGKPVPGCASDAVLKFLQCERCWIPQRGISQSLRRSRGAIAWALHYLQIQGLVQARQVAGIKRCVFEYRAVLQ